jgi:Holliday junction DNA helicase RuvA
MIGKLKGLVDTVGEDYAMIDVGGVGYVAFCSAGTLRQLPSVGEATTLHIETHVREDHIHLYGFASTEERRMFQQLTKINGVGNKVALAILSALSPGQIVTAIAAQDKQALTQAPGVGPKLAARLLTELKGQLGENWTSVSTAPIVSGPNTNGAGIGLARNDVMDAVSALVNLGYNRSDAYQAVQRVASKEESIEVDGLIREGLKELAGV